jgi:hypothetical protein
MTYVLRMIQNIKSDSSGIKNFGEAFFLGAIGCGPIIRHLAKKTWNGQGLKTKTRKPTQSYGSTTLMGFLT